MYQRLFCVLCVLSLLWSGSPVLAQESYTWIPGATYDSAIPTPKSVLGYEIGDYLTDHYQMIDYIHRLAESTDRVQIRKFGSSVERRDMYLVFISEPENLQRLEQIRLSLARLADPRTVSASDVEQIVAATPPIGWMNYANDGGETAAFEAGLQVAYQLAAGTDPLSRKIRQNVVTIINPAANPDSHQTFVVWMKAALIGRPGTPDPDASEHNPQWFISSDGNHYLIDSNRDAFALSQVETRAIARELQHWHPQVWIDNHGEPNEYTFAPFTSPVNLNYPASHLKWATEIGKNSARYFDERGWTYVKDETYDLYFPGYWDSYPAFNGAVAATYETNAGGSKGMIWEKPDGSRVVFRDGIHGHFVADLATLETLADNRQAILRDYHAFFKTGMDEVGQEEFKTYVLTPRQDPGRAAELAALFMRHGMEIYRTEQAGSSDNAQTYYDRQPRRREIPAGSFVIPLRQPRKRLAKVLLEPDPKMEDRFLEVVEATRKRNSRLGRATRKEGLGFYDVTAWALPLTYGVDTLLLSEELNLPAAARLTDPPSARGGIRGDRAGYGYLFSYHTDAGAHLLGRLLQEDYRVAMATRPFRNSGKDYPIGTLIARVQRNPQNLHDRIQELSQAYGAEVDAVDTAWSEEGITLGSRKVVDLTRPRILVMTNRPTQAVAFGGVYSLLEQRFDLEFTAARAEYFSDLNLYRYNVVVFPDGSAGGYQSLLGDAGARKLREWIQNGGVFVGIKAGAEYALMPGVELADTEIRRSRSAGEGKDPVPIETLPGTIFRATLNNEYYLGFGYPTTIAVQIRGSHFMSPSRRGTNVVVFPEQNHLQGHKWEDTEATYAGQSYLADVPLGRGKVILFADDPTFRAYWRGLDRLFLSAILLAPSF